jgi:hypothetical protein
VDTTFVPLKGKKHPKHRVCPEASGLEAVGKPEEYKKAFSALRDLGVGIVDARLRDDDPAFHVPRIGIRQQGCLFHAHPDLSGGRAFRKLSKEQREKWQGVISLIKESLNPDFSGLLALLRTSETPRPYLPVCTGRPACADRYLHH